MLEGYGRNERLAIALAFVLALGYIGFRMWSAGTGLPTSVNQSYSIDYAGFSLEKSVAIGKGAHEERL